MCHNTVYCFWLVIPGGEFTFISKRKRFPDLQFSTKMLRKTDVTMSNFKTKLPLPPQKNNVKVCPVLCTFNTFKLFREANLETEGQAITRLKVDVVMYVFLNIVVEDCRCGKCFWLLIKVHFPPGTTNQKQYSVLWHIISREMKMHVYRKRHTSDLSWEFLRIEIKQIKTVPNDSYG